eukprot:COSAG01_NODE_1011_length_12147_cov_12.737384_3_plen_542_part_00
MFSAGTIRVYQAYSDRIADAAVAANSFRAPLEAGFWSAERMTWIKPSAVWMAYRCGWTTKKDKNQARVLALDLCAHRFRQVMLGATVVHGNTAKGEMKKHEVIVQWDPERVIDPSAEPKQVFTRGLTHVRSIQVGLRGGAVQMLLDPAFVRRISDATPRFRQAVAALEAGGGGAIQRAEAALWKGGRELPWPVDAGLRLALRMDAPLLLQDSGAVGGPGGRLAPTPRHRLRKQLVDRSGMSSQPQPEAAPRRRPVYLFLDVDGVLHSVSSLTPETFFAPTCMEQLRRIVLESGCQLVLSSTWRTSPKYVALLNGALVQHGVPQVGDGMSTPNLTRGPAGLRWASEPPERVRAQEISQFLRTTARADGERASWVVLDDMAMGACAGMKGHFVQTDADHGLTKSAADAAMAILRGGGGRGGGDGPGTAAPPAHVAARRQKRLEKKLAEVERLRRRQEDGVELRPSQLAKLGAEGELRRQLSQLLLLLPSAAQQQQPAKARDAAPSTSPTPEPEPESPPPPPRQTPQAEAACAARRFRHSPGPF